MARPRTEARGWASGPLAPRHPLPPKPCPAQPAPAASAPPPPAPFRGRRAGRSTGARRPRRPPPSPEGQGVWMFGSCLGLVIPGPVGVQYQTLPEARQRRPSAKIGPIHPLNQHPRRLTLSRAALSASRAADAATCASPSSRSASRLSAAATAASLPSSSAACCASEWRTGKQGVVICLEQHSHACPPAAPPTGGRP